MSDDEPKTNDEPKTGYSILTGDSPHTLKLSYPLDDGRALIVDLSLTIQPASALQD
jgi:hypothetical protein